MIAEFTVENIRSFKERYTFSLISTKDKELLESNTFKSEREKVSFLKSAVIYGANASGKSNFFKALIFFLRFSMYSGPKRQVGDPIETEPFALSKQTEEAPSSFEIIFIIKNDSGETRYRYGFKADKKQILYEYLYAVKNVREVMLFTRTSDEIEHTAYFKEGARGKHSVRNNCTFLSVCAQNNGDVSAQIINYFKNLRVLDGTHDLRLFHQSGDIQSDNKIINFLKFADIQITDYITEPVDMPDNEFMALFKSKFPDFTDIELKKVSFGHTVYDGNNPVGKKYLDESEESSGTQKLFSYSKPILDALENGTPLFIDEFDIKLHPLIIESIVKLFNSPITNPKNAQLVVSCHSVNIMTNKFLRRDQIWFCEKDQYGATNLYSLVEYKVEEKGTVRKDSSYNKNYLYGKYGAVPYINDILLQTGFDNK